MAWVNQVSAGSVLWELVPRLATLLRVQEAQTVIRLCAASMLLNAALCLSGCVSVDERQIRSGVYVIATPASEFINSEDRARVILDLRAEELCPKGFMRFREDRVVGRKGIETMAWQVACTR